MISPSETLRKKQSAEKRRLRCQKVSQQVWDYLRTNPCVNCGEDNPVLLEFDHIDQKTKLDTISRMVKNGYSKIKVFEEIAKCQVLCANCHRKRTAKQLGWYRHIRDSIFTSENST